jgi:hypothetical protein
MYGCLRKILKQVVEVVGEFVRIILESARERVKKSEARMDILSSWNEEEIFAHSLEVNSEGGAGEVIFHVVQERTTSFPEVNQKTYGYE